MRQASASSSNVKADFLATFRVCAAAALMTCSAPSFAQQAPGKDASQGSTWGLGLAVGSVQKAYRGIDSETQGLPLISYENRYVKLGGPYLELKLPGLQLSESQRIHFGVVTKLFDGAGYEADDSPFLAGMAERKSSVWAGGRMTWENEVADVKLEWLGDASSKSKGQRLSLGLERNVKVSPNVMLIPHVGVEWVDKKFVDYYYGVRAGEARAGRAAYVGKSTANAEVGLTGIYRINRQHSMMLNVSATALGKEIKDSPLVDRSTESRVMLGYKYSF